MPTRAIRLENRLYVDKTRFVQSVLADKVAEAVLQLRSYLADPSLPRRYPPMMTHVGAVREPPLPILPPYPCLTKVIHSGPSPTSCCSKGVSTPVSTSIRYEASRPDPWPAE